ncbi:MAG: hypothetical protein JNL09_05515 [Anaerolineales bacterium]|nr:hypothetical protein [Anaerolineales bacterium]
MHRQLILAVMVMCLAAACGPAEVVPTVSAPTPAPTYPPSQPLTLIWHRSGGVAGLCEVLVASTAGEAQAAPCNEEALTQQLSAEERLQIQTWAVQFGNVVIVAGDPPDVADGLLVTLEMQGRGGVQPDETQKQQMLTWAEGVYARLRANP